jgi:hypothetical protein
MQPSVHGGMPTRLKRVPLNGEATVVRPDGEYGLLSGEVQLSACLSSK